MQVLMRTMFVLVVGAGLFWHGQAWAQTDTRGLVDRLDRLERDLNTLQSQVYRNQVGGTTVITSPALGGGSPTSGATPSGNVSGDAYSILDSRLNALESQVRDLTGQVEKINFTGNQLSSKIDRMQADNDFRFKELETKVGVGGAPAGASAGDKPPADAGQPAPGALPGAPPGNLVHSGNQSSAPPAPSTPAAATSAPPALVGKTPQEQYDYAFGLLRNSDYDGSTRAFQAFIAQHPQDPLAGNAMYWLGQIPYSQGQYEQAAVTFLDAYRKYPKSAKAGESLLKVGLAMSNLGKKKEACAALARFTGEYPDAADNLRRQATQEKQKLQCGS